MNAEKIAEFLEEYGKKVQENEEVWFVVLMMDDHNCVEFQEAQYYIKRDEILFSEEDGEIYDYLIENFLY